MQLSSNHCMRYSNVLLQMLFRTFKTVASKSAHLHTFLHRQTSDSHACVCMAFSLFKGVGVKLMLCLVLINIDEALRVLC